MRNRSKLLIAAISAIALLGMAVGSASARNLEVVNWERGFRITWNPLNLEAAGRTIRCPVTLEGSFERHTFAKAAIRDGSVSAASIGTCASGRATILRETLPWEVDYRSFTGTLPNITSVSVALLRASFQVETEGITCLARTETGHPGVGRAALTSGRVTGFEAEGSIETTGGFFCTLAGAARFSGAANSITVRGGTEPIVIRLI